MKIIDERSEVSTVAQRWKAQYCQGKRWGSTMSGDTREVYERLAALNPQTATAADVSAIIGNNSWAGPGRCHECGEEVLRTVELGEPEDYESHTAQICGGCLRKALELLGQVQRSPDP